MGYTIDVYERGDGWEYRIMLPPDPVTGKYRKTTKMGFKTKTAAKKAAEKRRDELEGGLTLDADKITVEQYLQEWLKRRSKAGKLAPRTLENYEWSSAKINLAFGKSKLSQLDPEDIEKFYKELSETLSPSSIHMIHRHFRSALNKAVMWGYLKRTPLNRVESPSLTSDERKVLTTDEALQVLEYMRDRFPVSYIATMLVIYTGLRKSEIAGLMWPDILWSANALQVKRARQRRHRVENVGPPKTKKSARTLPVSEELIKLLRDWLRKQKEHSLMRGESWTDDVYIIRHLDGGMSDPDTVRKDLSKCEKALQLPHVTFHDLRHTHATMMLESGVPLKTVSERLGHSSITLTADTYAHVTDKMHRDAVDKFDDVFKKVSDKTF